MDDTDERTDEQLLARYADGAAPRAAREAAFHELVVRFQRRVFAVCRRTLGGDAAAAEEATQEVFVRLARSAHTFRGDAQLSTWLYAVARNVATDRVRYEARRPSTAVPDVAALTRGTDGAGAAVAPDEHGAVEVRGDLEAALATLDPTSRTLLLLVAVEGLSYAEAAAAVDCAVGTAKSRVSRARVRLGELLADRDGPVPTGSGRDEPPTDATHPRPDAPRGPPR